MADAIPPILIITGSRHWSDTTSVTRRLERFLVDHGRFTLVEGGARGADRIAARWADLNQDNGVVHKSVPARWDDYPAEARWRAGHDRNQEMLDWVLGEATRTGADVHVLAFKVNFDWLMRRGGTEHMVSICKSAGLEGRVVGTPRPLTLV